MKTLPVLISLLLSGLFLNGQDRMNIDRLNDQLQQKIADTTRMHLLKDLALEYKVSDTAKAFSVLNKLYSLANANSSALGLGMYFEALGKIAYYHGNYHTAISKFVNARAQYQLGEQSGLAADVTVDEGNSYLFLSQFDVALTKYEDALTIFKENGDRAGISRCLNNMGIIYKNYGDYEKALERYDEVVKLYLSIDDAASLADTYINIGVVYVMKGEYHLALKNFNQALNYARESGNKEQQAMSLMNSGVIYTKMKDYQKAHEYYELALELSISIDDKVEISKCLTNIGTNYIELGEYELAETYIQRGLAIKQELGDLRSIANCYNFLAEIAFHTGQPLESISLDKQAIELKHKVNDPEGLARCYANLSRTYLAQKQSEMALRYADSSLFYSQPIGSIEHMVTAYDIKKQILQSRGDYREALIYADLYNSYSDSLMNERKASAVKEIEFSYQARALEDENQHLKDQSEIDAILIKRHKKIIYSIGASIILFALALILVATIQRRQRHYNRALEKKNQIITKQNISLDTLNRTKDKILTVITHDLRGTIGNQLTALSVLAKEEFQDEEERKIVFSRLANSAALSLELLENLAIWTRIQEGKIEFRPEKAYLDKVLSDVLYLFHESFENKELRLENQINEEFLCTFDTPLMKSVFKNLLSNAIKFTQREGEIFLEMNSDDSGVIFSISDTGAGISEGEIAMLLQGRISKMRRGTENEKGSGLGYNIIKTLLDFHQAELNIESELNKGTRVSFRLPFQFVH